MGRNFQNRGSMVVLNRYAPQLASSSFSLIFVSIEEGVSIEEALYVMFCSADMPCYVMFCLFVKVLWDVCVHACCVYVLSV